MGGGGKPGGRRGGILGTKFPGTPGGNPLGIPGGGIRPILGLGPLKGGAPPGKGLGPPGRRGGAYCGPGNRPGPGGLIGGLCNRQQVQFTCGPQQLSTWQIAGSHTLWLDPDKIRSEAKRVACLLLLCDVHLWAEHLTAGFGGGHLGVSGCPT